MAYNTRDLFRLIAVSHQWIFVVHENPWNLGPKPGYGSPRGLVFNHLHASQCGLVGEKRNTGVLWRCVLRIREMWQASWSKSCSEGIKTFDAFKVFQRHSPTPRYSLKCLNQLEQHKYHVNITDSYKLSYELRIYMGFVAWIFMGFSVYLRCVEEPEAAAASAYPHCLGSPGLLEVTELRWVH